MMNMMTANLFCASIDQYASAVSPYATGGPSTIPWMTTCREGGWEGWKVATAPRAPAWDLKVYHTKIVLYVQMLSLLH